MPLFMLRYNILQQFSDLKWDGWCVESSEFSQLRRLSFFSLLCKLVWTHGNGGGDHEIKAPSNGGITDFPADSMGITEYRGEFCLTCRSPPPVVYDMSLMNSKSNTWGCSPYMQYNASMPLDMYGSGENCLTFIRIHIKFWHFAIRNSKVSLLSPSYFTTISCPTCIYVYVFHVSMCLMSSFLLFYMSDNSLSKLVFYVHNIRQ